MTGAADLQNMLRSSMVGLSNLHVYHTWFAFFPCSFHGCTAHH